MRKLLNTLYVTTPESYLSKEGQSVVVSVKQEEVFRIPAINIENIVTFGYMGASPGLMKLCSDLGISLTFLSPTGKFIARMQGAVKGNVLLRTRQYKLSQDSQTCLHLSQLMIGGKIYNYRNTLARFLRDNGACPAVEDAMRAMKWQNKALLRTNTLDELRGVEGEAAHTYFSVFSHLILHQKEYFSFGGRSRRPPRDAVNAMLSFAYVLIANEVTAALETVGLDPYVGFLHTLRPGRASLALDLMEELRAYLGDRLVLSLINRKQITHKSFKTQVEEGTLMTDEGRKTFLTAWQNRKKEQITHPYLEEKIPIGLLPYVQATLLARYLRGELDDYPVFLMK